MRRLAPKRAQVSRPLTAAAQDLSALAPTVFGWDSRGWRKAVAATNRELPPQQRGDFAGITDLYSYEIHLAPWVCEILEKLPHRPDDELELADALDVFVHETRHLTLTGSNEAATECAALQEMPEAAVALGLDEETGKVLANEAWQHLYPLLPHQYRTPECRAGGALDEEPETPEFP